MTKKDLDGLTKAQLIDNYPQANLKSSMKKDEMVKKVLAIQPKTSSGTSSGRRTEY